MKKLSKVEIARRIRDNRYKFQCEYGKKGCGDCDAILFCHTRGDCSKEKVDAYIKRYSRKTKNVSRPNFMKAIKEGKEFFVRGSLKSLEPLIKVSGIRNCNNWGSSRKENTVSFCKESSGEYIVFDVKVLGITTEYDPDTGTFSDDSLTAESYKNCEHYTEDCCLGDDSCKYKDCSHYGTALPEPVKFDDPVPEYLYAVTEIGILRFKIIRYKEETEKRVNSVVTKRWIYTWNAHERNKTRVPFNDEKMKELYSFSDAVKIAESCGWK